MKGISEADNHIGMMVVASELWMVLVSKPPHEISYYPDLLRVTPRCGKRGNDLISSIGFSEI
jgi:hypothetical protein